MSLSFALTLASPPFSVTSLLSSAARLELARIGSRAGFGARSLSTTVYGSGAVTVSTAMYSPLRFEVTPGGGKMILS